MISSVKKGGTARAFGLFPFKSVDLEGARGFLLWFKKGGRKNEVFRKVSSVYL